MPQRLHRRSLRLFEEMALDMDATRTHVAEQYDHCLGEIRPLAERAEKEVTKLDGQAQRITADYRAGKLDADTFASLRDEIAAERAAAEAEADRLAAQVEQVGKTAANVDTDHELLRRLAELRVAAASRVERAAENDDVPALRAAISSVFEVVYLRPADHPITSIKGYAEGAALVEDRPLYVEPHLRSEIVEDYAEDAAPLFQRVPLRLTGFSGSGTEDGSTPELHNLTGSGVPE